MELVLKNPRKKRLTFLDGVVNRFDVVDVGKGDDLHQPVPSGKDPSRLEVASRINQRVDGLLNVELVAASQWMAPIAFVFVQQVLDVSGIVLDIEVGDNISINRLEM